MGAHAVARDAAGGVGGDDQGQRGCRRDFRVTANSEPPPHPQPGTRKAVGCLAIIMGLLLAYSALSLVDDAAKRDPEVFWSYALPSVICGFVLWFCVTWLRANRPPRPGKEDGGDEGGY
jgi:hypothetical protein